MPVKSKQNLKLIEKHVWHNKALLSLVVLHNLKELRLTGDDFFPSTVYKNGQSHCDITHLFMNTVWLVSFVSAILRWSMTEAWDQRVPAQLQASQQQLSTKL